MNLKLAIIHMDMVVKSFDLEPGNYHLGRSNTNDIVVQHFSLQPKQGRIFYKEEQWFYEDKKTQNFFVISDATSIVLSDQISLATHEYVENKETKFSDFSRLKILRRQSLNKRLVVVGSLVVFLLLITLLGYQYLGRGSFNESTLLNRVRDKIVEFEAYPDAKAVNDFKKYAGLTDADFKDSSGFCTGFLVGPNIVLTAAHCLFGAMVIDINNDFYLKTSDEKKHKIREVLGFDIKKDYLFLKTEGMESYGYLDFAETYQIEQKVYTVGNVHGEGIAIRDGIISSKSSDPDEPDVKFIRYSAGASPGNSGGPLLDANGKVVALVFASTRTENFNLGTPSEDLIEAYRRFAKNERKKQIVNLTIKRVLNFKPEIMLQSLSLPYLPQFNEYPEITQKFRDVTIDVEVPILFEKVDEVILSPLNQKVIESFRDVQNILKNKKEIVLDWKSFVSKETPAILPSQFDSSQNVIVKLNDRYYPLLAGLIDSPSKTDFNKYKEQLQKEDKFDFQAYGYNIQISDKKFDLLNSDVLYKPKNSTGNKQRLESLSFGTPYSQLLIFGDKDLRTPGFYGLKLFARNFLADSGIIARISSRFVRPQSMKDFTINHLNFDDNDILVDQVQDDLGRSWTKNQVKLFETMHVITYCIQLPRGSFCLGRVFNVYNDYLLNTIESNFRRFILSHLIINPYFWDKKALVDFVNRGLAKNIPSMNGMSVQIKNGKLMGFFSGFPLRFEIPNEEKIESVRLQTGLFRNKSSIQWTGYGLEWVQRARSKDFICGLGVEPLKSQSNFILNFLRDRIKQEKLRKIKGEEPKPLPKIWQQRIGGVKKPFRLYGYCAPLEEDPRINGYYFVDFKNSKAFRYKYKITEQ